jgi:Ca-activated chloride channel family protein
MRRGSGIGLVAILTVAFPLRAAAQGWIEPLRNLHGDRSVEKVRSDVTVRVEGRVAHVEVTEWFHNAGARLAEGHYLYPLPNEAVFRGFSLFQGDAELRGEIMDADRARAIYEEIVRRRADPALIELAGQGLLRARIFPIDPGRERKVSLRYTQVLSRAGDALQLVYAGAVSGGTHDRRPVDHVDRRRSPDAVETHFEVVADEGDAFLDPFSPTHTVEVRRQGSRLTVVVDEEIRGRFSLFLPLAGRDVGLSVATHRPPGEDGYFMLTLSPGRVAERPEPRDITVVMDVSGSMSGEKIGQAKAALRGLLGTLASEDRFRLVAFSNAVRIFAEGWSRPTRSQLDRARTWVDDLVADGGTNIGGALDEAFRLQSPEARLPMVIFLTDGLPSVGEQSPERLADRAEANAGRSRVFAFGVGHDVNTHLLDRLGEAGRGSTEYVEPGEDVERAITLLAAKILHPVLTEIVLADAPVRFDEVYPVRLPDVFSGEELVIFGRYRGDAEGRVRLEGRRRDASVDYDVEAAFPRTTDANDYIPRLWASRKLGHLTRQIWTEGESGDLVEEIRRLALRYGLPSPYTSYLVEEPDVVADLPVSLRILPAEARPDGGRRDRQVASTPRSPATASGAIAVRLAEDARVLREAKSSEGITQMEEDVTDRLGLIRGMPARMVAGRIFRLDDGVWVDTAHSPESEVVHIRAFSPAYFRLLDELRELRPVLRELSAVVVAGRDVSIRVDSVGDDSLSDRELERLVRRFRDLQGAP